MILKILILMIKKTNFNEHGININCLDKDGYNINGIKGTRKKYSNRKINWINDDNDILYDQYGFDENGFNKDGCDIYGFDLYKNKQITKQVYNILNKALINNDSKRASYNIRR